MASLKGSPLQMRQTIGYCVSMVGIALAFGIAGPSLPILARLTDHSYSVVSSILIARGVGDVCGMLMLPTMFRLSRRWFGAANGPHIFLTFQMLILALYSAVTALLVPLSRSLLLFAALQMASTFSNAFIDAGVNALLPWVWEPEKLGFWMNLVHCVWGIGAGLSPLIVDASFLIGSNDASYVLWSQTITALLQFALSFWLFTVPAPRSPEQSQSIELPLLNDIDDDKDHENELEKKTDHNDEDPNWMHLTVLQRHSESVVYYGLSVFLGIYIGVELGIAAWITTYGIELGMNRELATSLGTVFWWSLTGGRVAATLLSIFLSPRTQLIIDVALVFVGIVCLRLFTSQLLIVFTTAFLGFACASIFPNTVALPPTLGFAMKDSSTTIIMAGAGIGNLILPPSIGLLFDSFGSRVLPYFLFATLLLSCLVLAVVLSVAKACPPPAQLRPTADNDHSDD